MKKLLILLFVAAAVGLVISKSRETSAGSPEAEGEATAPSRRTTAGGQPTPGGPDLPVIQARAPSAEEPREEPSAEPTKAPQTVTNQKQQPGADHPPVVKAKQEVIGSAPPEEESAEAPAPKKQAELTDRGRELLSAAEEALSLLKAGKRVQARAALTPIYLQARGELARQLREILRQISQDLVFNPRCLEGATIHTVEPGETLTSIGKKYDVNWRMIKRINGMQHDRLTVGQQLKIIPGPASIVAVKSEFRLALMMGGAFVKEYPIGIGKDDKTPGGEFVVDTMLVRPRWYKPGGGIVEYGEEGHLLGERWIGFADQPGAVGIGIHGTNQDETIGTKCSNGCVRMRNEDVIELYGFVQPGSKVTILE